MINHAMFQRNGRSGLVLKPLALRSPNKDLLMKHTKHMFQVKIISAQQLPRPKNAFGYEIGSTKISPFVEVSLYVPDWPLAGNGASNSTEGGGGQEGGLLRSGSLRRMGSKKRRRSSTALRSLPPGYIKPAAPNGTSPPENDLLSPPGPGPAPLPSVMPGKTVSAKTSVVKNNGFNPVWEETLQLPFECVGDMMDLIFVRFVVECEDRDEDQPLAVYCASLGSLARG
jgi:phosphatidylinositol phospholipase C, delta